MKYPILLVDDEENWLTLLTELLETQYAITAVKTHTEALAALWQQEPKFYVVIVDIRLNDNDRLDKSGLELVKGINRYGPFAHAIVITGYPSTQSMREAFKMPAFFDYIEKFSYDEYTKISHEFNAQEFLAVVNKAVAAAEEKRALEHHFQAQTERTKLRTKIERYFRISDLHVLCFDLAVDYEMLEGALKSEKIVSLLLTLEKRGQIPQLLKQCQLMFPHVRWATLPEAKP